jgi:alpha-tubulin suppressor-like RCC1 family protein
VTSGAIECWGDNYYYGQLGNNGVGTGLCPSDYGYPCSTTPVQVSTITNAAQISAGGQTACAALADGTVDCWGNGGQGQTGNPNLTGTPVPVLVSGFP